MPSGESESSPSASLSSPRGSFARDVLPALAWTALVFLAGSIPSPVPPVDVGFSVDKLQHALAFAVLALLAQRALRYELPGLSARLLPWLAATVSTFVGGALELYQVTVPNRSAEVLDLAADAAGAFAAATAVVLFKRAT